MATETVTVSGRINKPFLSKINPLWWFKNDDDPSPPAWYHGADPSVPLYQGPAWSDFRRKFYWFVLRNPLHNFMFYVLGLQDKNYKVWGKAPVALTDLSGAGLTGQTWCFILPGGDVWVPRFYYSLVTKLVSFHFGWNFAGALAIRFIPFPELHN